jgi:hypothetical protein
MYYHNPSNLKLIMTRLNIVRKNNLIVYRLLNDPGLGVMLIICVLTYIPDIGALLLIRSLLSKDPDLGELSY